MDKTIRTFFIALFFLWINTIQAQQAQELFLLGNKAYEMGDFKGALRHYQTIKKKGPALWYNMGNCYYHENDFVHAIACWQRALSGATLSLYEDIQYNCMRAYQKLSKSLPQSRLDTFIAYSAMRIPILMIQFLFLFCWLLLCMMIMRWPKNGIVYGVMIGLCMTILYLGMVLWHQHKQQHHAYGIVIHKTAPLYVGPHAQYHVAGVTQIGDQVQLVEKRAEWYKVSKDGATGWMPSSAIEVIGQLS